MEKDKFAYYHRLCEVAEVVNLAGTPDGVRRSLVESVAKALESKACSIMLITPDRRFLHYNAAFGLSDWYLGVGPVSADKSISEALEGKPVAVLDATEDERIQYREETKREGIASILSVPMMLRGQIIGVIRVYTGEPRQFTEDDIHFVSAVANLGAIALENAKVYDSLRKEYEAFKRDILDWRFMRGLFR